MSTSSESLDRPPSPRSRCTSCRCTRSAPRSTRARCAASTRGCAGPSSRSRSRSSSACRGWTGTAVRRCCSTSTRRASTSSALVLQPQDLIFLAALLVIAALALFFTALAGRLWCGYACPQTVYSEIFQWIELKHRGRPPCPHRDALDKAALGVAKIARAKSASTRCDPAGGAGRASRWWATSCRSAASRRIWRSGDVASWPAFWVLFAAA